VIILTKDDGAKLLELLRQQQGICKQLLSLTTAQKKLIEADDMEAFNKSLDARQELMDQYDGQQQQVGDLMVTYTDFSKANDGKRIAQIEKAREQLMELLEKCFVENGSNEALAKEKSEAYSAKISDMNQKRKGIGSYIQNVESNSDFIDKMS